jgi:Bacterial regulatory protein, arsR family
VPLDHVLSALGDPIRLAIIRLIADGQEHVRSEFDVDIAQSTLSHHVKTLRDAPSELDAGEIDTYDVSRSANDTTRRAKWSRALPVASSNSWMLSWVANRLTPYGLPSTYLHGSV